MKLRSNNRRTKFRRFRILTIPLIAFVILLAWQWMRVYDSRNAAFTAKALGWKVETIGAVEIVKYDWKELFRSSVWREQECSVTISDSNQIDTHLDILRRLRPTSVTVENTATWSDLVGLSKCATIQGLYLYRCDNLNSLRGIDKLERLSVLILEGAARIETLDGIQNIRTLEIFRVRNSPSLASIDALRRSPNLRDLMIEGTPKMADFSALPSIPKLRNLHIDSSGLLSNIDVINKCRALMSISALPQNKPSISEMRDIASTFGNWKLDDAAFPVSLKLIRR